MSDEIKDQTTGAQTQSESPVAKPSPAADDKLNMDMNQFQSVIRNTVEDVLKNSKLDETRKLAEEYNSKIAESVQNAQSTLIKSNRANGQESVDYIKRVIDEDSRRRFQSGEGKAMYSDKGEDFIKAKIILLKKMGLSEEEIAKELTGVI